MFFTNFFDSTFFYIEVEPDYSSNALLVISTDGTNFKIEAEEQKAQRDFFLKFNLEGEKQLFIFVSHWGHPQEITNLIKNLG